MNFEIKSVMNMLRVLDKSWQIHLNWLCLSRKKTYQSMQNERFHFRCEHSPSFGPSLFCRCLFVSVSSCLQHYWVYNLFSQNTVTINYGRSDYLKRVWRNDAFHQEYTNYGKYQLSNNNSLTLVHEMLVALHYRNFRLRCHQDNKKRLPLKLEVPLDESHILEEFDAK